MGKKILYLIFSFCLLTVFGSDILAYNNAITTDPIDLINAERINLKYEHLLGKKNSFTAEFSYDYQQEHAYGLFLGGAYRWYLRNVFPVKTAGLEGFILGPYARLGIYNYDYGPDQDTDFSLEIGGEVAYKWVFWGGFAVEPIIRIGFGAVEPKYKSKNLRVWPGISIGYAW